MKRWLPLLAAAGLTAVLAGVVALGVTAATAAGGGPAPKLNNVPPAVLTAAGLTLSGASQPPYCTPLQAVGDRGWAGAGLAGCPIGRQQAEKAVAGPGRNSVQQAVLASASMPSNPRVGRNHLVWVLVVNGGGMQPMIACPVPARGGGLPGICMRRLTLRAVDLVDAHSGALLASVGVAPYAAAGMGAAGMGAAGAGVPSSVRTLPPTG